VADHERALSSAGELLTAPEHRDDAHADDLAAILVAEDAVLRTWTAADAEARALHARTARNSLASVGEGGDDLIRNAAAVASLLDAIEPSRGSHVGTQDLARMTSAIAELLRAAGVDHAWPFFKQLVHVALDNDQLPPVGVIGSQTPSKRKVFTRIAKSSWVKGSLPGTTQPVWAQTWASPLVGQGLMAGLVMTYDKESQGFGEALGDASGRWPTVLLTETVSTDAADQAAEGAAVLVRSGNPDLLGRTLTKLAYREAPGYWTSYEVEPL
jgi:hypothetical protein